MVNRVARSGASWSNRHLFLPCCFSATIPNRENSMPVVDMPIEELRVYTGTNPRPTDFDEYWDAALVELDGVAPDVEIREEKNPEL